MIERPVRWCIIGAGLALLARCISEPPAITGGSSDTEVSARISGVIVDKEGKPSINALVRVRPTDYLPGQRIDTTADSGRQGFDCRTDTGGAFFVDSVVDGDYLVEVLADDSTGAVAECRMVDARPCTISTVMQPLGMVLGEIEASYENESIRSRAMVEVFGTEHVVHPDSGWWFKIPLAAGEHRIKISIDSSSFDSVILNVQVEPEVPRSIGIVRVNYMPQPPCWEGVCDSIVLRNFLDSAKHPEVAVHDVTQWRMGRITVLNLSGIPISIPLAPLGQLSAVEELDLSHTGIADTCRFLYGMWNLRILRLNDNNITGITHFVEGLYWLEELILTNNKLTTLPEKLTGLTNMKKLNISGNQICILPPNLGGWIDLFDQGWYFRQACTVPTGWMK
jgi:hypothetical protein